MTGDGKFDNSDVLVDAARKGSPTALDQLFRIVLANCPSRASARRRAARPRFDDEDLLQEAALQAVRRLGAFRGTSKCAFINWFDGILRNKLAELLRNHLFTKKRALDRQAPLECGHFGALDTRCPSENLEREDDVAALQDALGVLPEHDRRIIELHFWWKLPFGAIAAEIGESTEAVRSSYRRAILRLRSNECLNRLRM